MTRRKRILAVTAVILLLPVLVLAFLVSTQMGLHALYTLATPLVPGEFSIRTLRGSLIDEIELNDVRYSDKGTEVEVRRISLAWQASALFDRLLRIEKLHVDGVKFILPPPEPDKAKTPLPDIRLPLQVRLDDVRMSDLAIYLPQEVPVFSLDRASLKAQVNSDDAVIIESLQVKTPLFQLTGAGSVQPQADYPLALKLSWTVTPPGFSPLAGAGLASGNLQRLLTVTQQASSPFTASLRATVAQALIDPAWDVDLQLRGFETSKVNKTWPQSQLTATLKSQGTLKDYALDLVADVAGQDIPTGHWIAQARGNEEALTLSNLRGDTLGGVLKASGSLTWQPALQWQMKLEGQQLNPGLSYADWPGSLSFAAQSAGSVNAQGKIVAINTVERLEGMLRGYPVSLQTRVEIDGNRYRIPALEFSSGSARFSAAGTIAERWDVQWKLAAPDLNTVHPDARGSLSSAGSVGGTRDAPRISASLAGADLIYQDVRLKLLDVLARFDPQGTSASELTVKASDLALGEQIVDSIVMSGTGTPVSHQMNSVVTTPKETVELTLVGRWVNQVWNGQLTQAELASAEFGRWNLEKPVLVQASSEQAQLSELCWRGAGRLCAQGSWQHSGNIVADLNLRDIPLALGQAFLPEGIKLDGLLSGTAAGSYGATGVLLGNAVMSLSPGSVSYPRPDAAPLVIQYQAGELLKAVADEEGLRAQVKLTVADTGKIEGDLNMPRLNLRSFDSAQQDIAGNIKVRMDEFGLLAGLAPELEKMQGLVDVNLDIAGKLAVPTIHALANIQRVTASMSDHPVNLNGQIEAIIADGRYQIPKLDLNSGTARLTARGGLHENWDLIWQLDVPDLASVLPEGSGSLNSQGTLKGPRDAPEVAAIIKAKAIAYQDIGIAALDAQVDLDQGLKGTLKLDASSLRMGEQKIERIVIDGTGSQEQHRLTALVKTPKETLDLALSGAYSEQTWTGTVSQASVQSKEFGIWKLAKPVAITAAAAQAKVAQLCLEGSGRICGQGTWQQGGAANADVSLQNVPLALFAAFLPEGVKLTKGATLAGDATVKIDADQLIAGDVDLTIGSMKIAAKGTLGARWDVSWSLDAPILSSLLADANGSAKAQGSLGGPRDQPAISATINGQKLVYQDIKLAKLDLTADIDAQGNSASSLKLDAKDLLLGKQIIRSIALNGSGTPGQHQLGVVLTGPKETLDLDLNGSWAKSVWNGKLTEATLQSPDFGAWKLDKSAPIRASAQAVTLGSLCLVGQGRLCLEGTRGETGNITAELGLRKVPLALAQIVLPQGMKITGNVGGNASLRYSASGSLLGEATLTMTPGSLSYPVVKGETTVVQFQQGSLRATADKAGVQGDFRLALIDIGTVDASFSLPQFNQTGAGEQRIAGKLRAKIDKLGVIAGFVPALQDVKGRIDVDLDLGGRLSKPSFSGYALYQDGAFLLTSAGIEVREVRIEARSTGGQTLQVQGRARSGEGDLNMAGTVGFEEKQGLALNLKITGDRFQALNLPEAKALISPDLTVASKPGSIDITGEIRVPEANLGTPAPNVAKAVLVSDDVVIVNDKEEKEESLPLTVTARVRVILGDEVKIAASGLTGSLTGSLVVTEKPQSVTTAIGDLRIVDGKYQAYGQDLSIQNGQFIFSGGPIDNPGLAIRAVRMVEEITAGVRVEGTVKQPTLTLFSDSALSDANILSYLIIGRPTDQLSGQEGSLLLKAASTLGINGGDALAKRIGDTFGLDSLGIESDSTFEEASLVLGKYLSPRLYINYGIGVFNHSSVVRLRYDITKRLSIQTETGTETGADIVYTIER